MSKNKNTTIRDVAKLAEASLGTVSRVINDSKSVSPKLRMRVELAMQELGYIPNAIARSMRTQSTQVIGFMADDFSNPLFASMTLSLFLPS